RLGGGSRNGAQRLGLRDGRREQRGDVVEDPLDPRLSRALVEARGQLVPLRPAAEEDKRRQERDHARGERCPKVAADRSAALEHGGPQDRRGNADAWKDEGQPKLVRSQPRALAPQIWRKGRGDAEVCDGNRKQRHRVEENRLALCTHWAQEMIGAAKEVVEAFTAISPISKDGPNGLLAGRVPAASVSATGRCAPGRYLAICPRGAIERGRRHDPPSGGALLFFRRQRPAPFAEGFLI